jgi:ATP-dependent DNA helicase RecG
MQLDSPISQLPLVGPSYEKRLETLGIITVKDLVYHVPHRYLDFSTSTPISACRPGEVLTVKGEIVSIKNQYTRSGKKMQIGEIKDKSGKITVVFFNQPYLVRTLYPGSEVSLAGKVDFFGRKIALISPEYEIAKKGKARIHTTGLVPIYPETKGVSSKWLRGRLAQALEELGTIKDYLPEEILKKEKLMPLQKAILSVHFPEHGSLAEEARQRLAFDELVQLHLSTLRKKAAWRKNKAAFALIVNRPEVEEFINSLPFKLTASQKKVIEEIMADLTKELPMNRLLEGDVGSGKTVVAATAAFIAFLNGCQSVFMAPTQILAQQHYETLSALFAPFKVRVALITSQLVKKDLGRIDIFVGTHALIHKRVDFHSKASRVALVVIDEQHRFGVEQRQHLVRKVKNGAVSPHVLTMTATPIPRTVALTLYGDLDLSVLDQMPPGRKKVTTWVVNPQKRGKALLWIKEKVRKEEVQCFVICPLIEESEKETMQSVKAATKVFEELKKVFGPKRLGLLHGRLPSAQKQKAMSDFRSGSIDVLVATPVVEVGIDVANASVILIEAAERFGLAQLHQLRGRVGRGKKKSYCLLFSVSSSPKVLARLSAMEKGSSGFELAELDLKLRGPGEVYGTKQHGFSELKIASWQDSALIARSHKVAEKLVVEGFVLVRDYSMV